MNEDISPERLGQRDVGLQFPDADLDVFRSNADEQARTTIVNQRLDDPTGQRLIGSLGGPDVDLWRADEPGREEGWWPGIERRRRRQRHDGALRHDRDPIRDGRGLRLIMGHEDGGHLQVQLEPPDLGPDLDSEVGVEVRERFVEQEDHRLLHQRPSERDPLPLAARKLVRPPSEEPAHAQEAGDLVHVTLGLLSLHSCRVEREADVLADGHVRVDRVILEDVTDAAALRSQSRDVDPVEQDSPRLGPDEPGDEPEGRGLAAARRPHERHQLAVANGQVEPVHGGHLAVFDGQALDVQPHGRVPFATTNAIELNLESRRRARRRGPGAAAGSRRRSALARARPGCRPPGEAS